MGTMQKICVSRSGGKKDKGWRRNRSIDTCECDGGVGELEESRSWERREEKRRDLGRLGNAGDEKPKLGAGRGVKRGEQVRVGPAAPLRTGYPARETHLSLPTPLATAVSSVPTAGTAGEERRGVAFCQKTPEENKSSASEELRSHQSPATEGPGDGGLTGTAGRCVPSCLRRAVSQRFDDSVVFFILC